MSRSLAERARDWKWWGEQVAHTIAIDGAPIAILLGFHHWGFGGWEIAGGTLAATWIMIVRELVDQWPIDSWGDTAVDALFTVLGGTIVGLVFWAVA